MKKAQLKFPVMLSWIVIYLLSGCVHPDTISIELPYGTLRVGVASLGSGSFDPMLESANFIYLAAILDPLIGLDPTTGKPSPAYSLVESWTSSTDGKDWTFILRKGVKFQDGSDLTSADVKFSLERPGLPNVHTTAFNRINEIISSIEVRDMYTVLVHLKPPTAEFWRYLAGPSDSTAGLILPQKYIQKYGYQNWSQNPIGSGPWKFVEYRQGQSMKFEAVGNWRIMPRFKYLQLILIPDENTRTEMLEKDQLDIIETSYHQAEGIKNAGLRIWSVPAVSESSFALWGHWNPALPISDLRVRQALSLAIDRQALANNLFGGYASPAAVFDVFPSNLFYDPTRFPPLEYNPEKAKSLLREAGYPNGFDMKLYSFNTPDGPFQERIAEALVNSWKQVDVQVEIVPVDLATFESMYEPLPVSAALLGNANVFTTVALLGFDLDTLAHSGGSGIAQSPALDAQIDKVMETMDPAQYNREALKAAELWRDQYLEPALLYQDFFVWTRLVRGDLDNDHKPRRSGMGFCNGNSSQIGGSENLSVVGYFSRFPSDCTKVTLDPVV